MIGKLEKGKEREEERGRNARREDGRMQITSVNGRHRNFQTYSTSYSYSNVTVKYKEPEHPEGNKIELA